MALCLTTPTDTNDKMITITIERVIRFSARGTEMDSMTRTINNNAVIASMIIIIAG